MMVPSPIPVERVVDAIGGSDPLQLECLQSVDGYSPPLSAALRLFCVKEKPTQANYSTRCAHIEPTRLANYRT